MITFYPGPSKLFPGIETHFEEALNKGILSLNHRSGEFVEIYKQTVDQFKTNLNIPDDYEVYFVSSATEVWEILNETGLSQNSAHIFNGAFGKKWHSVDVDLHGNPSAVEFGIDDEPKYVDASNLICLTHSETSNGTIVPNPSLSSIRENHNGLIAIDATSSLGGIDLEWENGDIWFASVQKCLGLPAGMAVMVWSPSAIDKALSLDPNTHYNSFTKIRANGLKNQTTHTPNILNIFLLSRVMEARGNIVPIQDKIVKQAQDWYSFISDLTYASPLITNSTVQSPTVIAVELQQDMLEKVKATARKNNIMLGRGYGNWLNKTFRIANFPAHSNEEITVLKEFLSSIQ